MGKNPEKIAGNHGDCYSCGNQIFCNEIEYKGTKKLQWQGEDGKAHYKFNQDTKTTTCKQVAEKSDAIARTISDQRVQLKDIELDMETLTKTLEVSKSACQFLKAIEFTVYEQLGSDANPAHIGLYVKIIADKMLGLPNLQQILEEVGKPE